MIVSRREVQLAGAVISISRAPGAARAPDDESS
jgi:hypothetical protein